MSQHQLFSQQLIVAAKPLPQKKKTNLIAVVLIYLLLIYKEFPGEGWMAENAPCIVMFLSGSLIITTTACDWEPDYFIVINKLLSTFINLVVFVAD